MRKEAGIRSLFRNISTAYRRLFAIEEIETNRVVQWMFGAMTFYCFVTFFVWIGKANITVGAANAGAICWPFFPNCGDFYFLEMLPYGYSQSALYMVFYGMLMLIVYCMWQKRWVKAHALLTALFAWKVFVISINYLAAGPYDYYHLFLTAALLFVPHKEYFMKVLFVFFYFVSVTVKFTPAWVLGTYFTSLAPGAPFIPASFTVIATNIVIFVQIVECWFLLSRNWVLQRISLAFALFFHLYSGVLVFYNYPSITLPAIAILFGPMYRHTPTPFKRSAIGGWVIVVIVGLFQLLGFSIPTDRYMTLEGNRFGMFMFESNHQCIATVTRHYNATSTTRYDFESPPGSMCGDFFCLVKRSTRNTATSSSQTVRFESATAWNRCDPYEWWARLHLECEKNSRVNRVEVQFDHSLNGGPFYRIVDTQNICDLEYKPFVHNEWIRLPAEAEVIGYPVQNWYH